MQPDDIEHAFFASFLPPQAFSTKKRRGSRRRGILYEKKVQEHFTKLYGDYYLASPWLRFKSGGNWHWCQPDGIHFDLHNGIITIVEVKLSHTSRAYAQLYGKYLPVLSKIFEDAPWEFHCLEVVKWFDPHAYYPGRCALRKSIDAVRPKETGVLICTP